MKRKLNIISVTLFTLVIALVSSCSESFTEQDALNAQQQIDLALYIINESDPALGAVVGATVTISQNGVNIVVKTDSAGAALFPKIKVGSFVYRVEAANFISAAGTGSANSTNLREGQLTVTIGMISTSDGDLATLKGTLTMESDVTNLTREFAVGVDVFFDVSLNSGLRTFATKTDGSGNYLIKLPTNPTSLTPVKIRYADFEAGQTIGLNQYGDEIGSFTSVPQVLPRKEIKTTLFSMSLDGEQFRTIPAINSIRSLFAIVDPPPSGGVQAIVNSVTVNAQGQITGVGFSSGGNYNGDTDGVVTVVFTSLDGGSGAILQITLGSNSSVSNAYLGFGTGASTTLSTGSGYPTSNFTLNKVSTRVPSARTDVFIQKGTISVANGDYGTGIYRARQIL